MCTYQCVRICVQTDHVSFVDVFNFVICELRASNSLFSGGSLLRTQNANFTLYGSQMLTLYKIGTAGGRNLYPWGLTTAIHYADVLAANMRDPASLSPQQSPWPFRVNAETGLPREDYTASVIGPIKLFDELVRMHAGNGEAFIPLCRIYARTCVHTLNVFCLF